ncbi:MAG TPA: hypothetical protein VFW47_13280 [Phenylobacterium sp.]|nr:hypothetical protein [Phenylobacterium sp.]
MRIPLAALPPLLLIAACTTLPADGSTKIQTTSQARRENLQGVVTSPLRDVNVLRTKIPDVLLQAMADPYARPSPASCAGITRQMLPLNGALGADLDELPVDEDDLIERGRESVMGAMAGATSGIIPFRGWVRQLSGAERHDSLVAAAITAGAVRRAYLKGLGEARGCNPPATPSHVKAGTPPVSERRGPKYPIR